MSKLAGVAGTLLLLACARASAQTAQELKRMSLEQLLEIEVTSVSRVPEQTMTVPAAVHVITGDEIRRSGATSIPEALRLAPGVQVARLDGGTWSIGIRGFADRLARSMLVLIDGRSVYSPLFAGTYWENQDTLLEDIDRIEVIRGPGGTLWGANAVNGIINIITKRPTDTIGVLATVGAGSQDRGFGALRFGGTSGPLSYRAYVKALDRGPEFHATGDDYDGWREAQAGFRGEWALASGRTLTLQGDLYDGRLGSRSAVTSYTSPFTSVRRFRAPVSGGNVLARLSNNPTASLSYQLQMFYDRTNRVGVPVGEDRDTVDVDFQSTVRRWSRHTLTWGAGYRLTSGRISALAPAAFIPAVRTDALVTGFAQDELALSPRRWHLTLGAKFLHNPYSGAELQPTARVLWIPRETQTVWAAVTRAVRTPSRVETDYTVTSLLSPATPTFVRLLPNPNFDAERLTAYEAGYRVRTGDRLYATASAFYNDLQDSLSTELLTPFAETAPGPPRLIVPVTFANGLHGNSQGIELTGDVRPASWWRVTANYSYVFVAMSRNPGGQDVSQERQYEGAIPHHQVQGGASFDVSRWSIDGTIRYISALAASSVPAYAAANVRIAWQPRRSWEVALVGQNLLESHHLEWPSGSGPNVELQRSVYVRLTFLR